MQHLQPDTTLQDGKYRIERLLGQGGFGITYLAEQCLLKKKVTIKEFFIRDLCSRGDNSTVVTITQADMVERYRQKFFKEAQIIARMEHPHIVRVTDIFEENDTVYYVMDYVEGESLADIIKRNGPLPEKTALRYISKVADALDYIHQSHVNHLDIKPANIMIRKQDYEPVLIDFGVSKQYDEQKDQTTTTPPGVSDGYSPLEQYKRGGVSTFSPQADIYALGATLYKLLTGNTPPSASDMLNSGLPPMPDTISVHVREAIEKAMQPRIGDRPKSVRKMMVMMKTPLVTPVVESSSTEEERTRIFGADDKQEKTHGEKRRTKKVEPQSKEKRHSFPFWPIMSIVVLLLAGLGWFLWQKQSDTLDKAPDNGLEASTDNEVIDNLIKNMVYVEGGTFTMGATPEQGEDVKDNEQPAHEVTLSSYYIGRYEVTQEEWEAVMGNNPSEFKGATRPVENVSWNDSQEFISKLNSMTGKNFRLPTEAEWEFAARGGNSSRGYKYAGGNDIGSIAWNSCGETHNVGTKQPNELGLNDMAGNVWEWCNDWYGNYSLSFQSNPKGAVSGYRRVIRGGSWAGGTSFYRVADRSGCAPNDGCDRLGFRLAL